MARPKSIPKMTPHASGQGVVRLDGHDHYCGRYGSPEAESAYQSLISKWLANGRSLPEDAPLRTVNEIALLYLKYAKDHYKPNDRGVCTEFEGIKSVVRVLREHYGRTPATEFGPKALKTVRDALAKRGLCRSYLNHQTNRIRRMFRWATEEELVPAMVYHALHAVAAVRAGTPGSRESDPVRPVPTEDIEATLKQMSGPVSAMVRLQLLSGMRPGEVIIMRSVDIDRTGKVWRYTPSSHKTAHHGKTREIYFGPQAQEILAPWVKAEPMAFLFSPTEAEQARNAERAAKRKTPRWPSHQQRNATKRKATRKRAPKDRYNADSYRRAIAYACDRAFPPPQPIGRREGETKTAWTARLTGEQKAMLKKWKTDHRWHPHRLRHSAATNIRKEFGIEIARILLGHSTAFTTEIYAETDRQKVIEAIGKVG